MHEFVQLGVLPNGKVMYIDPSDHVIAAINVTGSLLSLTDDRISTLVEQAKQAAEKASRKM